MEIKRLNRKEITDLNIEGHDIVVKELHRPQGTYDSRMWYAFFNGKEEDGQHGYCIDDAIRNLAYAFSGENIKFDDTDIFRLPALQHTKPIEA